MNDKNKRFLIAVFLLSLVPWETNFSQQQNQLIKPCTAETTPKKNEDTTNTAKKKKKQPPKTKDGKKDKNEQSKNANCN